MEMVYSFDNMAIEIMQTINSIFGIFTIIIGINVFLFVISIVIRLNKKRKIVDEHLSEKFDLFESIKSKEDVIKELEIVDKLKLIDSTFNRETFKSWIKMTFIKVQEALIEGKFKELKKLETNELYEQHKASYNRNRLNNKQKRIIEDINIDTVLIYDFQRINGHDVVSVFLNVYMIEYIKDIKTNKVLKGSDEESINKSYTLTFIRKIGKKKIQDNVKNEKDKMKAIDCPNCGAPLNVTSIGTCEYCGSYIKLNSFNWILSDITLNKN